MTDLDVAQTPHGTIGVTLSSDHGTLSIGENENLTYATGDGVNDEMMRFVGTLNDVNVALESFQYKPHPDYNGMEEIQIRVTDQEFTGSRGRGLVNGDSATQYGRTNATTFVGKDTLHKVKVHVRPKNDRPVFTIPAPQTINEDVTLLINGKSIIIQNSEKEKSAFAYMGKHCC